MIFFSVFVHELEPAVNDHNVAGQAFVKYERRLHMYVVYCQNKPKSEYLVGEFESFFQVWLNKNFFFE